MTAIASLILYARLLALDPRDAVTLAARLERADEATLMHLCVIESGGCRRVGIHARARPNVARRPGLGADLEPLDSASRLLIDGRDAHEEWAI